MTIAIDTSTLNNADEAIRREWLETNGLGGWASSTIAGANSRRYHGILVAATQPPVGRIVMLSKLDETLIINGERFSLGANCYPGAIHPRGFDFLKRFEKGLFPRFEYEAGGIRLRKTIVAPNGENTTLILFEVLDARGGFVLELLPLMSPRDYHNLSHANDAIQREAEFSNGLFVVQAYEGVPRLFIDVPGSTFEHKPDWYHNVEYSVEQFRGLDYHEDLFSHGVFRKTLTNGERLGVIVSTQCPSGRDAFEIARREEARRTHLLASLPVRDEFTETLTLAADQFIVKRGDHLKTIIAGYHWFSDWGRDTMIALPGLCLATGRYEEARNILRAFAQSTSNGMLPNRFPDSGEQPEYNTVDATLWFFVAVYEYLQHTDDVQFVLDELLPVLRDIIDWHDRGTRYNIHVDSEGLLYAGEPGVQLTWMDAKVGDWVVTPRQGKAVEINALWYNALRIMSEISDVCGMEDPGRYATSASEVKKRFQREFWNEETGGLFDWIDGDQRDPAIRPNQIFALSLPFPLFEGERARSILRLVEEHLLTPVGLRSLAPSHPSYRSSYGGDQLSRDSAYHQGTVWSWLIGPYVSALLRFGGPAAVPEASSILHSLESHFREAGIGTISEIFDAEPPHTPRGCIAQAWSVGEMLRAYMKTHPPVRGSNGAKVVHGPREENRRFALRREQLTRQQ